MKHLKNTTHLDSGKFMTRKRDGLRTGNFKLEFLNYWVTTAHSRQKNCWG